ncbi:MAG: hypothetical protein LBJ67_15115 [Planctomycetaceae bacterium]|jgi:WD40 repeat protein|nr:hypothetical protein [Planctomycetaceae bacterium]
MKKTNYKTLTFFRENITTLRFFFTVITFGSITFAATSFMKAEEENPFKIKENTGYIELVHKGIIRHAVFSPDGKLLASEHGGWSTTDGTVTIWDIVSGKKLQTIQQKVNSLRFSPDSKKVVAACDDKKEAVIWDVTTGQKEQTFNNNSEIRYAEFSPNGKLLLTKDDGWEIWSVEKGIELKNFGHGGYSVATFSSDGKKLLLKKGNWFESGDDLLIIDIATGKEVYKDYGICFSPDGTKVYKWKKIGGLVDMQTEKVVKILEKDDDLWRALGYRTKNDWERNEIGKDYSVSADRKLAFFNDDYLRIIGCWEIDLGNLLFYSAPYIKPEIVKRANMILRGMDKKGLPVPYIDDYKFFHLTADSELMTIRRVTKDSRNMTIENTTFGSTVIGKDNFIPLKDYDTEVEKLRISPDGNYLAQLVRIPNSDGYSFQIYDLKTGDNICKIQGDYDRKFVDISPDNQKFMVQVCVKSGGYDNGYKEDYRLQLWDIKFAEQANKKNVEKEQDANSILQEALQ